MEKSFCINCSDSEENKAIETPPKIKSGAKLAVEIIIPEGSGVGLKQAADDLNLQELLSQQPVSRQILFSAVFQ